MKKRFELFLIFFLTVFTLSLAHAQSGPARGKGRIKGNVSDPSGKPIVGVQVQFANPALGANFELKTDAKGEWVAGGVAGGQWNVDFVKEGYGTKKISAAVYDYKHNDDIKMVLEPVVAQAAEEKKAIPGIDLVKEGNALKDKQDYAGAVAKYEQALAANPALTNVYVDMGSMYSAQKQYDKAIESYNKFLETQPTNSEVKIYLADVLLQAGKNDEAQKALADVNLDTVQDGDALYNLGARYYNAGNMDQAIRFWEKSVQLNPKNSDAHLQLGLAYYSAKKMDQAKAELQKVVELDPSSDNAKSAKEMLDSIH